MSNPSPKKTDPPTAAEVDELGQLQAWLARNKTKIDREEELRKRFAEAYEDEDPEHTFEVDGTRTERQFVALIGPRGNRREIVDVPGVFRRLGKTLFFAICTLPLGKLDALMDASKQKGLVVNERTGPRSVKVIVKPEKE